MVANGGPGFAGDAGVLALGDVSFDSVTVVPGAGYVQAPSRADSTNAALERWYTYSWTSHLLSSRPTVYAVRTAAGIRMLAFLKTSLPSMTGYWRPCSRSSAERRGLWAIPPRSHQRILAWAPSA